MQIVIFVPTDVYSLELAGLMDVFAGANARVDTPFYEVTIVAEVDRTIRCASGLRVLPDCASTSTLVVWTPSSRPGAWEFRMARAGRSSIG